MRYGKMPSKSGDGEAHTTTFEVTTHVVAGQCRAVELFGKI